MKTTNTWDKKSIIWWTVISFLVILITVLHYTTPTMNWQYHLVYMQAYFVPILMAAFQFGLRGGVGVALAVSILYLPHVMLQWGGLVENNLMRFMQIILYNVIGFLTGLKAQKEKEEKIRFMMAAEELEKSLTKLREQSEKLIELEEYLRQADRMAVIGELTASLAHEVRNPLASIRGTVEILRDEVPESIKASEFFHILIEDTQRLNDVVENYLGLARRRIQPDSDYPAQEPVHNVVMMLRSQAAKQNVAIDLHLPDDPVMITGDPGDLWQIILNVALNALQAMKDGGAIRIDGEITTQNRADFITISINDNGPGIPEDQVGEIFKPFFTTKAQGTGLGLAIVKRLVNENKWEMNVDSAAGKGTTVKIKIPVKKA